MLVERKAIPTTIGEEIRLVRGSGMFNAKWYLQMYPDVAMAGLDPVEHYLRYGARLDRNPSPGFDTARYMRENSELFTSGVNPLVHYLLYSAPKVSAPSVDSMELPDSQFKGCLDRLDEKGIVGWAIDESQPGKAIELSVFANGEHVFDMATTESRQDLVRLGMPGDRAGFAYSWSSSLFPRGTEIDVRFKGNGWSLAKSPRTIVYGPVSPHKERSLYFDAYVEGRLAPCPS